MAKILLMIIIAIIGCTGCNNGRYEVARNHLTNEVCYVFDWKTNRRIPATPANIKLADSYFWADPEHCHLP
jgi:hypothetical protein